MDELVDEALSVRTLTDQLATEAQMTLADTIACAVAGGTGRLEPAPPSAGRSGATVWDSGAQTTPSEAARRNAFAAHISEWDSVHYMTAGHPGTVIFPVLMAEFDLGLISSTDLLRGYVVGLETMAVLGYAYGNDLRARSLHPTVVLGSLAAVFALGNARGHAPDVLTAALRLVGSAATGTADAFGTNGKAFQVAAASRAAYEAVSFAANNPTSAADTAPATQPWYVPLTRTLGGPGLQSPHHFAQPWALEQFPTYFKKIPACAYFTQTLDQIAVALTTFGATDLVELTVEVPEYVISASKYPEPTTPDQARFSLPYLVACLWKRGAISARDFTADALTDPHVRAAMARVGVTPLPGMPEKFGDVVAGDIRLTYGHGDAVAPITHRAETHVNTWVDVTLKVVDCVGGSDRAAENLVQACRDLHALPSARWSELLLATNAHPRRVRST